MNTTVYPTFFNSSTSLLFNASTIAVPHLLDKSPNSLLPTATSNWLSQGIATIVTALVLTWLASLAFTPTNSTHFPTRHTYPYIGAPGFFMKPYNYIAKGLEWTKGSTFSFSLLGVHSTTKSHLFIYLTTFE
jgi:hypothetical protein